MATGDFTGQKPRLTYDSLIHVESNEPLNLGYQYLTDGLGNRSTIELSTTAVKINNVTLNGTVILGSPLELSNGGLGASLSDPGADRILFWDDSAGAMTFLTIGTNLSITGTTLNATGGGAGLVDGDYGDITVSGTGTVMTIDNLTVTYAKIQNVSSTDKILGRVSSGAGSIEEITFTDFAQSLADDVDASAARTTLGLGTLATQSGTFSGTSSGTNTGDQTITLTGPVTGSGTGSFATTITNGVVTYAKIQDISATSMFLGRKTGGAGSTEELTASDAKTILAISNTDVSGLGTLSTQSGTFSGSSSGTNTGDQLTFKTISVAGQSDVVADTITDTLTIAAGANITITTNATTDTITIAAAGGGGGSTLADGDYGDVTASGSGTTITIDNDVVTYAKMQNVSATDKVLGRATSGAGDVEEITLTAFGRSLIDDAAASNARTTLGVVIGTDVQAYDDELAAIAGLTSAANKGIMFTGAGTAATYDLSAAALTVLDDASTSAMLTTLGGQPLDTELTALAGLTSAADKGIQFTGSGTAATYDLTTAGKALLDDADATAQRTTLGLGTLATQSGTFSGTSSGTNTGDQTITLTGAVTGSGTGSFATAYGDTEISSIAGLTSAADTVPYYTGSGTAALATFSTYGRSLVDDADASASRTTLGVVIGTNVQAYDATLAALAAFNSNGSLHQTAADTFVARTLTGTANQITVTNGDGVAGNPTLTIPYNLNLGSSSTAQSSIAFFEDTDNGSNKITLTTPATIGSDYTFTLPPDVGTVDYVLRTDGSGTTTWVAQSGGGGTVNLGLTSLVAKGLFYN